MFDSWHSYPSIYNLGHKALELLLDDQVVVQEKVDGSQFSFGRFDSELRCRSKGAMINIVAPDNMFKRAVDIVSELPIKEGWTYRAEYLLKPKHNSLAYDRIPQNHLAIFDINPSHEEYLPPDAIAGECARLNLESVPLLFSGRINQLEFFRSLLDTVSFLGGQKIEGVVIKNYAKFGPDKKALMGKFVSEKFREVHSKEWKKSNPSAGDVVALLVDEYRCPARWQKAVQHMREAGRLEQSPRDIGPLLKEVNEDVMAECQDEIKEKLFKWAWKHISRQVTRGLPEWYKEQLMEQQFNADVS